MVPNAVTIVSLYTIIQKAHLLNTYWAIFLPYVLGSPYTIFLMRQFFRNIPQSLIDAARVDGASEARVLFRIIVPMSKPVIITATLIAIVFSWNNFLWPLIVTNSQSHYVLTIGLALFQTTMSRAMELSAGGLGHYPGAPGSALHDFPTAPHPVGNGQPPPLTQRPADEEGRPCEERWWRALGAGLGRKNTTMGPDIANELP